MWDDIEAALPPSVTAADLRRLRLAREAADRVVRMWRRSERITGMGDWLQGMIAADAGTAMLEQLGLATGAWRELFAGRGLFGSLASFGWNVVTDLPGVLDAAFDLFMTLGLTAALLVSLIVVFALGQAQVMWAQIGLSIALVLGPVFIPWMLVPQLSFLFWGWFRTVLVYSSRARAMSAPAHQAARCRRRRWRA